MLSSWHLQDRWWERERRSVSHPWRVQGRDFGVYDLEHAAAREAWLALGWWLAVFCLVVAHVEFMRTCWAQTSPG
jgi:hypothetical protein